MKCKKEMEVIEERKGKERYIYREITKILGES
jgi:hypothetical protein